MNVKVPDTHRLTPLEVKLLKAVQRFYKDMALVFGVKKGSK